MEQPLYDLSSLEEVTAGDQTMKETIIQLFLTTIPDDLKAMEAAIENKNYSKVSAIAHKIKPSINYVCINQLLDDVLCIEMWKNEDEMMVKKTQQFISTIHLLLRQLRTI